MKFILIAVYMIYPPNDDPKVDRVEIVGTYKTMEACQKETHMDFGSIPPGLAALKCVLLKKGKT